MIGSKEKLVWCPFITRKTAQWDDENTEATYFTHCTKEDCICYNRYEHNDIFVEFFTITNHTLRYYGGVMI